MNQPKKNYNSNSKNIFITLKILILFFCIIPVTQPIISLSSQEELLTFNLFKMMSFLVIISLVTLFWFVTNYTFKNRVVRATVEMSVMFLICALCYVATGMAVSGYKFVFALVVLIYTMEYGLKTGMVLVGLSGLTIMVGDILSCTKNDLSSHFQADIILTATFCMVAYIVGFYVEKDRRLIEHLRESVNRDALTGLFNHRYFHQYMRENIGKPSSEQQYLFIADIDYFKVYNDTLGHQKGDRVLKKIAVLAMESLPVGSLVFRYGGEEFAIIVTAKSEKEVLDIANRFRTHIADYHFEGEELMPGHNVTISVGISARRGMSDTVADWIERADNALYKAKFFRKNRVQLYTSMFERFDHMDRINDDERIISIKTLLSVINSRDRYTYNHTDRVVHYCEIFSKHAHLSEEDNRLLLYSAYLHDIGKINIPQEILISEKHLNDEQWEQMKRHPQDGAEIVQKIENFDQVADIVCQHHEKYDGTGYPNGLKGSNINPLARILMLADSFDAMTAKRPYQKVKTFEEAFSEIRRCKGTQFDPQIAEIFISAINEVFF